MATASACIWQGPERLGAGISRAKMRDPVVSSVVAIVGRAETLTTLQELKATGFGIENIASAVGFGAGRFVWTLCF